MKILISAAETSSDAHGAKLLEAIRAARPDARFFGIGGPKLQAVGLEAAVDARELLSMGFTEIIGKLPRIFRALRQIEELARREKPDIAVVIDYPDFHFKLARRLKALGVPVVYYIPPKVWAWRTRRVHRMRELFDRILCILPFEEAFYREHGLGVRFVGNPLVDELPLQLTREEARRRLGLGAADTAVVLMPGSRPSELREHLELFLEVSRQVAARVGRKIDVLLPLPATSDLSRFESRIAPWKNAEGIRVRLSQGDAAVCLAAADAGLIKSGTSTLEAGMLQCPHVVVYRPSRSTQFIFDRIIRYRGPVGLVNLVSEEKGFRARRPFLVREIVNREVTEPALADELQDLLCNPARREAMLAGFRRLREKMDPGKGRSPSVLAAQEILELCRNPR